MKTNKLLELSEEKRMKVLKLLERDALFSIKNYRLNLTDWKRHYEVLELLKACGYRDETLTEALLDVSVATRTEEEDITLNSFKEKLKSTKVAKLSKVKK